jgi:hypothetical protein
MLRVFAAFLAVFWVLGLIVHLDGSIDLFGLGALGFLAIDRLVANYASPRSSRTREESVL